jgi:hypothetical protein
MTLRHQGARGWTRAAQRIGMLVVSTAALSAIGCEGLFPIGDTSLDGSWRITVFSPGSATGTEIATVVISGGQPQKLTGLPGVPPQLANFGLGDIPLGGNSINLFNVIVITGNGTLVHTGNAITLRLDVSGTVTGQPLSFSATFDGNVVSDGLIEGTATLNGALFGDTSVDGAGAAVEFQMVRL